MVLYLEFLTILSFYKVLSLKDFYRQDAENLVAVDSSFDLFDLHFPAAYFFDGGRIILEFLLGVLFHDEIKRLYLLLRIINEFYFPGCKDTAVFHGIAAGDLFALETKQIIGAESYTYVIIIFQYFDLFPMSGRMKIDHAFIVTEIERQNIG
jgi:hypothetical protein